MSVFDEFNKAVYICGQNKPARHVCMNRLIDSYVLSLKAPTDIHLWSFDEIPAWDKAYLERGILYPGTTLHDPISDLSIAKKVLHTLEKGALFVIREFPSGMKGAKQMIDFLDIVYAANERGVTLLSSSSMYIDQDKEVEFMETLENTELVYYRKDLRKLPEAPDATSISKRGWEILRRAYELAH